MHIDGTCTSARPALTRRQLIAWSVLALSGLTIASRVTATGLSAGSDTEGNSIPNPSQRDLDALSSAGVIYVATVRKDGNQSMAAPVWFTISADHRVLIQTQPNTWKAKRIRRGSPVIIWIGRKRGPAFIGKAQISDDPAVQRQIVEDFPRKYLMARFGFHRPNQEVFEKGEILSIVITPVRDLPDGFTSAPGTPAPALDKCRN